MDSEESAKISIERFAEPLRKPEAVLFRQYLDDNPRGKANALYTQNCTARHGAEGRGGASIALANPVYLAIVDWRAQNPVQRNYAQEFGARARQLENVKQPIQYPIAAIQSALHSGRS